MKQNIKIDIPFLLQEIVKTLCKAHSGKCYLVGGALIDSIYHRPIKDWDIEVFHHSYENLLNILERFGDCDLIGKKFGIIKFKKKDLDIEFSIPRKENNLGPGHKDFDIQLIPNLSLAEAAQRRDFTINAIYMDLETKELHDPYGGLRDLKKSQLNTVSNESFIEDPLRIFRGMQLLSRKVRVSTQETRLLCTQMIEECKQLSPASIYGEWVKMLMLGDRPDRGLKFLDHTRIIELYPELTVLKGTIQSKEHHPEGDVWTHTQMVTREAAKIRNQVPEEWRLAFMFAAVLHDIGKPATTRTKENGKITSYGHDNVGVPIAERFMRRITNSEDLIDKVKRIVLDHLQPRLYLKSKTKPKTWRKAQNRCPLNIIALFTIADCNGRDGDHNKKQGQEEFYQIMEKWKELGSPIGKIPQKLLGRHLIAAGHKPGKDFSIYLDNAYKYQINTGCVEPEELIKHIKG